jgi:hypothetical protein
VDFIVNVAEVFTVLVRDRPVIIYDNAVRTTAIPCVLNFMNCVTELPMMNVELIADVFCWVARSIPNDPSHTGLNSPRIVSTANLPWLHYLFGQFISTI